jgi:hypothetical protein
VSGLFVIIFFVLLFGVFKPFKGVKRWQFGLGAFVAFILVGVFAPDTHQGGKQALTDAGGSGVGSGLSI